MEARRERLTRLELERGRVAACIGMIAEQRLAEPVAQDEAHCWLHKRALGAAVDAELQVLASGQRADRRTRRGAQNDPVNRRAACRLGCFVGIEIGGSASLRVDCAELGLIGLRRGPAAPTDPKTLVLLRRFG